jgi:hypothetical protein
MPPPLLLPPPPPPTTSRHDFTFSDDLQLTTQVEVSREAIAAPSMIVTSPVDALSSVSTSAVINSVKARETLPPAASSSQRISTLCGFEKTWYQTCFVATRTSFHAPLPVVTNNVSFIASFAPRILSLARSTRDDSTTSPSIISTAASLVSFVTSFSTTPSTGTFMVPSKITVSSSPSPIKRQRSEYTAVTSPGASHMLTGSTSNASLSTSMPSISAVSSADASAVLKPSAGAESQRASRTHLPVTTTISPSMDTASSILHHLSSKGEPGHQARNTTTTFNIARPTPFFNSTVMSTKLITSPDRTSLEAPHTSAAPHWNNSTTARSVLNLTAACDSTLSTDVSVSVPNFDTSATSTLAPHSSDARATRSATAVFSPSSFVTESAATSPPISPPLTASQMAGAAIAGTAGVLIAVIAALYVARRYRNKHVRRTSSGSIYPKAAYLYNPPAGGAGYVADLEEPYISCRTTDILVDSRNTTTSATPPSQNHEYNPVSPADQFRDLGSPCLDSDIFIEYPSGRIYHSAQRSTDAATVISTTVKEHRAVSKEFPTVRADASQGDVKHEMRQPGYFHAAMTRPSLPRRRSLDVSKSERLNHRFPYTAANFQTAQAVTRHGASRIISRRSILSEITSVACNSNGFSNDLHNQLLASVNLCSNHSLPDEREALYTDSWRDPFEHDLLVQVDKCSETPDSMAVFAYPATNDQTARSITPLKARLENSLQASMASPMQTCYPARSSHGVTTEGAASIGAMIARPERSSPAYSSISPTKRFAADQMESNSTVASVSPLAGAMHRGWDDIKRFSVERVVPSVPIISTLQETPIYSLRKKKSLFYL